MNYKIIFLTLILLLLSSCGRDRQENIIRPKVDSSDNCKDAILLGPDTYMTFTTPFVCRMRSAIEFSNSYCIKMGKETLIKSFSDNDVIFQCLEKGDKDLYSPTYEKYPDIVIRNR